MRPIHEFINKIKWDKRENPDDYSLFYIDRLSNGLKKIKFNDISGIEDKFLVCKGNSGIETKIPLHRIRIVKKGDEVVWIRNL